MKVFLNSLLPVESLAFPYIFYNGPSGTWRPLGKSSVSFAQYCKLRSLSYGLTSVDRTYIFILFCEKVGIVIDSH